MDTKVNYTSDANETQQDRNIEVNDDIFNKVVTGLRKTTREIYLDSIVKLYLSGVIDKNELVNIR